MTRSEFEIMVMDNYGVAADYPFEDDLETGVFRHTDSKKWFGIAMNIDNSRIDRSRSGKIDVVNLKCPPEIIESMVGVEPGIYRAYHMNKTHWLTVALAECDDDCIAWLLGISHNLTGKKIGRR